MKKPLLQLSSAIAVAALSAACIILPHPGESPGWRTAPQPKTGTETGTETETETGTGTEFQKTIDFRAGGTLSLENDYGDVEIRGWDRDTVEVVARAAAGESQTQRSARQYQVRTSAPDVEIRETDNGLLIRTRTFEGRGDPPEVDYEVRVPNSVILAGIRISEGDLSVTDVFGRLKASLDQGDLEVDNYSGSVDVSVGTGNADVEVLDLREEDSITISCRSGDIILRLEPGAGAIVEADAPRGRVRSDFDLGVEMPVPTLKAWIGEGGPAINLRASNGRIDIASIKDARRITRAAEGK